jgi:hypothetical protein
MADEIPNGLRVFVNNVMGGWYAEGDLCVVHHGPGWMHLHRIKRQGPETEPIYERREPPGGNQTHGGGIEVREGAMEAMEGREAEIGVDGGVILYLY